jgi:alkaline phosphatase D
MTASAANYAVWDDHDFGTNNSGGGPNPYEPEWKTDVWRIFTNNWNNPDYGSGDRPGGWFDFSIGDVDVFMLDDRYYRTEPENVEGSPTMLGPAQRAWLLERMQASGAAFKLLVTSVPWAYGTKPGARRSLDTWQGYKAERDEIFSALHEEQVEGVVLLAGDRHRADIWKVERDEGYDLYNLENGRLTNLHTHSKLEGALKSYNEKCTFGRLAFDTTKADPKMRYECINIDGEVVHDFTLRRSQLSYG